MTSGLLVAVTARTADAQRADAQALFNEGNKLMKEGKLGQACERFEASNRLDPGAGTLIRLGECRQQNAQLASAWTAYNEALGRAKDPRKRAIAKTKVAELEPRLSHLVIAIADASRVDGLTLTRNGQPLDVALWNLSVPVDGGDYLIVGRASGFEDWTTTVSVPVEAGAIRVEVPKLQEVAVATSAPATTPDPLVATDISRDRPSRWTTRRKLAIGLAGASAAGLVTGIVLGLQSRSKQDAAHALCASTEEQCMDAARANRLIDLSRHRALGADIAFGVAAAAAIGAGALWFTGAPESAEADRRVTVMPHVAPGEAGVVVFGRL